MNAVDATWHGLSIANEINVESNYIYRGPTDPGNNYIYGGPTDPGTNQNIMGMGPIDPEPNNNNHGCDPGLYPVESYGVYPASVGTGDYPDLDRSGQRRVDTLPCAALGNNYIRNQSIAPTEQNPFEESWWISDVNKPSTEERNHSLMDFVPQTWELGSSDLQSLFTDYYYNEHDSQLELAAAQTSTVAADCVFSFENDGSASQIKGNPDNASYWASYFGQLQDEQWEEHELQDVNYAYEVNDWLMDPVEDKHIETEVPTEPEVIMAVDQHGNMTPMASVVMVIKDLQGRPCSKLLRVLFDSGGSTSMIHRRAMPKGTRITQTQESRTMMNTLAGPYAPLGSASAKGLRIPAFDKNRVIDQHEFLVFDAPCNYDIILGVDFLKKVGIKMDYENLKVEWLGNTIPMESLNDPKSIAAHVDAYLAQIEMDDQGFDIDSYAASSILDAKYDKTDIDKVIRDNCSHLDESQQQDLRALLLNHAKLFDGSLGKYPGEPMHIELEQDAQPVYRRPYPVPQVHLATFKKELEHLVELGVLSPVRDMEWGLPTFITPKKDGRVRWVSDLRELNKVIKRTQYTLPLINDVLRKRKGYEFLTKLDISMQFYTFELDEESKKLCTIVTPFGPYCYNRVPMGLKISPGYAQARMEEVLRGIEEIECYIDDIEVFTNSWARHMAVLEEVLTRLENNGFTINPLKCEWAVKETDWLGYWLTPDGLKPWNKKVDAILKMKPPTTATELRTFFGHGHVLP